MGRGPFRLSDLLAVPYFGLILAVLARHERLPFSGTHSRYSVPAAPPPALDVPPRLGDGDPFYLPLLALRHGVRDALLSHQVKPRDRDMRRKWVGTCRLKAGCVSGGSSRQASTRSARAPTFLGGQTGLLLFWGVQLDYFCHTSAALWGVRRGVSQLL
jgi:hypothetical protein